MADIHCRHHATIRYILHILQLHFTQAGSRSTVGSFIVERSYLHKVERKLSSAPFRTQVSNKGRHKALIKTGIVTVAFSLVPQESFHSKMSQGSYLRIIKHTRSSGGILHFSIVVEYGKVDTVKRLYGFPAHPCLHFRSSPGRYNNAYGYFQHFLYITCKIIRHGTDVGNIHRGIFEPFALAVFLRRFTKLTYPSPIL